MEKYLVLNFKNAGLFRKNRKTKDKIFDIDGRRERLGELEHIEPITSQQISNMLHVLFGERPKPMNRETVYPAIDYLIEKGKKSYLKIDSYKDENGNFYSETIQLNKAVHNSWNPISYMNWNRVKKLLDDDSEGLFTYFTDTIFDVFDVKIEDTSFNNVKSMILNSKDGKLDEMFKLLNSKNKKPLYNSIYGSGNELTDINKNSRTKLTVLTGLDKIIRLSGEILVPVSDDDIEKIKMNKGCATLLDGGHVSIKKITSANIINVDNFTLIGDISLEKK
jgi:hypothetical protein